MKVNFSFVIAPAKWSLSLSCHCERQRSNLVRGKRSPRRYRSSRWQEGEAISFVFKRSPRR